MKLDEIDYSALSTYIPRVLQFLYNEDILKSITLVEFRDAFRINQLQGKAWLLEQLKNIDKNTPILVVGSWMGFTSYCLFKMGFKYITETDKDDRFTLLANSINMDNVNFKHLNKDVNDVDLSQFGLIINTSCEHISDNRWFDNINANCLVALQSTNFKCPDHVNTVDSLDEMKIKYPMAYTYEDELAFNQIFKRYMLIGIKS